MRAVAQREQDAMLDAGTLHKQEQLGESSKKFRHCSFGVQQGKRRDSYRAVRARNLGHFQAGQGRSDSKCVGRKSLCGHWHFSRGNFDLAHFCEAYSLTLIVSPLSYQVGGSIGLDLGKPRVKAMIRSFGGTESRNVTNDDIRG